jgi:hypothetical protein
MTCPEMESGKAIVASPRSNKDNAASASQNKG